MKSEQGQDVTSYWDELLTETDRRVIANAGYGKSRGLGNSPLVMVIDCQYNYVGADEPVDQQQDRWPAGGGEAAWRAVRTIATLLAAARAHDIPVLYTRNVQKRTIRFDSFAGKSSWDKTSTLEDSEGSRIVEEIAPVDSDFVLDKSYASAFYGTPLLNYLIGLRIDTLVVCGVSTGGCVRATSVDGVSRGFKVTVVADAVADRIGASHKVALLDMWMKYTDITTAASVTDYFAGVQGRGDDD